MSSPVIIVPDTAPLIHLASGAALHALTGLGQVVVPDVVALEASGRPGKPYAAEIAAWLAAGQGVGVVGTRMGAVFRLAAQHGLRAPGSGELAITEWLRGRLAQDGERVMVVSDDKRVPRMLALEDLATAVSLLTTRALLETAAAAGVISSAEEVWERIVLATPTASPRSLRQDFEPRS